MLNGETSPPGPPATYDALTIGQRIRSRRLARGWSLATLAGRLGRATSQLSMIENGRREPKVVELQRIAGVLEVPVEDLLRPEPPSRRAALEIALERAQRSPLYTSLGLPDLPIRKSLGDEAIETILALHDELVRIHEQRAATPEDARHAIRELRAEQRRIGNYYATLEEQARQLLAAIGHRGGPISRQATAELAEHLGFTLHYVPDLPHATRSVTDLRHRRIYLSTRPGTAEPRSTVLKAIAAYVLDKHEPTGYGDLLRQRVETNYLAGAILVPERSAVPFLSAAKSARTLSVEDLRDRFAVSYEVAAHRFSNLATQHLGIPVHFLKVHESGAILEAYENDNVRFPTDALGAVEGQIVCRWWSARQVFAAEDRVSPFYQYTDQPVGVYWCTSRVEAGGFGVDAVVGDLTAKAELRGLLDTNGRPLFRSDMQGATTYALDGAPLYFPENGGFDASKAQLIAGNFKKLVYSIRQDVTVKLLDQGVIQDPTTKEIVYNLAQQDMVALRVVMRMGWALPNPATRMNADRSKVPFAFLTAAAE